MNLIFRSLLYCLAISGFVSVSAHATIVRMDLDFGQQSGSVYIQLYDAQAPVTVANFLRYIEDSVSGERRYDNTFFHRSVPGFIIQGGGYVYDPDIAIFASMPHIPTYDPIVNEFDVSRSNVRGTIAMAKLGGDPDSATSEWFFNLADNSANLDNQNGGFTVFGEVLGNSMEVIDTIAALDLINFGGNFQNLPVADLPAGTVVAEQNLVRIADIVVDPPASVSVDIVDHDFGLAAISTTTRVKITLQNVGSTDLANIAIGAANPIIAPFSVDPANNSCSQSVVSGGSCTFDVLFTPTAEGQVSDSFSIETNDVVLPELTIQLHGAGAPVAPTLEVSPTEVNLGNVGTGEPVQRTITVRNIGGSLLLPAEPVISGVSATEVSMDNGCALQSLASGESCDLIMTLTALSAGEYSATVTVNADPGAQSIPVAVTATATPVEPEIRMPAEINMGDTSNGQSVFGLVSTDNIGIDTLYISDIQFVGDNSALFSVSNKCIQVAIPVGSRCIQQVTFASVSVPLGELSSTMRVLSNDPDTPVLDIPVVATVSSDSDGVPDVLEAAGPNGGDGNQDGVPDVLQENVASLPGADGGYVTVMAPDGTTLSGVRMSGNSPASNGAVPISAVAGASVQFRKGFFFFVIEDVPVGGTVSVTLLFQAGLSENSYFKYGKLPGEPSSFPDRWHLFDFREDTGTGARFNGNTITLRLTDGGRGDLDGDADGRIVDPGGPAVVALDDGASSSGGGGCSMKRGSAGGNAFDLALLLVVGLLLRTGAGWRKVTATRRS